MRSDDIDRIINDTSPDEVPSVADEPEALETATGPLLPEALGTSIAVEPSDGPRLEEEGYPAHDVVEDGDVEDSDGRDGEEMSFLRWLVELVVLVGMAFLLATAIKTWVVQPFYVPSGSMEDTIEINDRLLVNKFIYKIDEPETGDIVVFKNPDPTQPDLIKRVIAVGGQTVDIRDGVVSVDGQALDEPYITPENRDSYSLSREFEVPKGYFWAMGDNRANSGDSRVFGPQPLSAIEGRAFLTYWPVKRWGTL